MGSFTGTGLVPWNIHILHPSMQARGRVACLPKRVSERVTLPGLKIRGFWACLPDNAQDRRRVLICARLITIAGGSGVNRQHVGDDLPTQEAGFERRSCVWVGHANAFCKRCSLDSLDYGELRLFVRKRYREQALPGCSGLDMSCSAESLN